MSKGYLTTKPITFLHINDARTRQDGYGHVTLNQSGDTKDILSRYYANLRLAPTTPGWILSVIRSYASPLALAAAQILRADRASSVLNLREVRSPRHAGGARYPLL